MWQNMIFPGKGSRETRLTTAPPGALIAFSKKKQKKKRQKKVEVICREVPLVFAQGP
jgi:hypothetical protein